MRRTSATHSAGRFGALTGIILLLLVTFTAEKAVAHCDTMNGPVVKAAQMALEKGDVRFALVWVRPADEREIRSVFEKVVLVRRRGEEERVLADRLFFETLVRLHRAGEGAPFDGIKDSTASPEPGIAEADRAIAARSQDQMLREVGWKLQRRLEESFREVQETGTYPPSDVHAGRTYVEAYVRYIHLVERLYADLALTTERHGVDRSEHQH